MQVPTISTTPAIEPMPELSGWIELLFLLFALGLMVWVAYRLWGRSSSPAMRVLARLPLEPKRTLYIVEVAGQHLLIGAGEGGLSTLATLDSEQIKAALDEAKRGERPLLVKLMEMVKAGTSPAARLSLSSRCDEREDANREKR